MLVPYHHYWEKAYSQEITGNKKRKIVTDNLYRWGTQTKIIMGRSLFIHLICVNSLTDRQFMRSYGHHCSIFSTNFSHCPMCTLCIYAIHKCWFIFPHERPYFVKRIVEFSLSKTLVLSVFNRVYLQFVSSKLSSSIFMHACSVVFFAEVV
jgi:hypothetical protein